MPQTPETTSTQSAEVIDFNAYKNRALIEILEEALVSARAGVIDGAVMVLRRNRRDHGVVVTGAYKNDPEKICALAGEIFIHFNAQRRDRPTIID